VGLSNLADHTKAIHDNRLTHTSNMES
jgi:hypothetical protein